MSTKTYRWRLRHDEDCERTVSNLALRCTCGARRDRGLFLALMQAANSAVIDMPTSDVRTRLHSALHAVRVAYPRMPNIARWYTPDGKKPKKATGAMSVNRKEAE